MRLRVRLAMTTVAIALPLLGVLGWLNTRAHRAGWEEHLGQEVLGDMLSGGRERCEAGPRGWQELLHHGNQRPPVLPAGGPRRLPPQLYAYDGELRSLNPTAPPLLPFAARAAAREAGAVLPIARDDSGAQVLVKMPWLEGPCRYILAVALRERRRGELLPTTLEWGVPLLVVLLGLVVSMGPLVQRIRRLTQEVRLSAQAQYRAELSVTGNDEIAELARAFASAQSAIRAQYALQTQRETALRDFLANTTHDVMTPLTVLQGHLADLALQAERNPAVDAAPIHGAVEEAHYIAGLVHNLALAAKLDAGVPDPEREAMPLNGVVERAVGRHFTLARQLGVLLEQGAPPESVMVEGDVTMLEQAVSNVVSNAVRYNRRGGHVAALLERAGPEQFTLRVIDDGPGLEESELNRILERGFRTDAARTRSPAGQGLGLNIAQEVAKRHGWTLQIRKSEYGGLEVTFQGRCQPAAPPGTFRNS